MRENCMRLRDAGVREQEWAQSLILGSMLPQGISFADMLDHAVYDAGRDVITMTIRGVPREWKVNRP